jgi:clan AA aspartic protease (TIGR02281 family)
MKRILILLIILGFISTNVFAQTKIIMQKEGGVYTVPCKVNGLQLKFIFDTGASDVSISLTEALFMFKNGYLSEKDITGTQKYSIANGDIAEGTTILLKEIEIADLKLYNVRASIVHELSAPLLLGQTAIAKLGKIQLDGNELVVMTQGNKHYDYSADNYKKNNINQATSDNRKATTTFANIYPYNHTFSGVQSVYTYSPILEKPDMINSPIINGAENNQVTIIEKVNDGYYKVKSGNTVGYLWAGWFKK